MYNSNEIWETKWVTTQNNPIINHNHPEIVSLYGGISNEPHASIGMCSFLEPVNSFENGFKILDYGCGAGVLANFISARLNDFTYYGLEPLSAHGIERITIGQRLLNDPRVTLGHIESHLEDVLKQPLDCITLISVFTHLTIENIYKTLDKLIECFKISPKAKIVFSCFISEEYSLSYPEPHINEDFYGYVTITQKQLDDYIKLHPELKLKRVCDFSATPIFIHNIFELSYEHEKML